MARIICPECGNEIGDKAKNCPYCGVPLQIDDLACPKCSSKLLHTEKDDFSDVTAVADWVFTGGSGLLAGTIGNKDIFITCLKCNHRFKAGEAKIIKSEPEILDGDKALQ